MHVRSNLFKLKNELERIHQRDYTIEEIARASGLSRHTVTGLLKDNVKAIYFDTIVSLISFLRREGLNVGLCDLLVLEENSVKEQSSEKTDAR